MSLKPMSLKMAKRQSDSSSQLENVANKDGGNEAYEEYLLLLQQRNKLLKTLKEKDEKQLDLERKEQGFSLYLNGANVGLHLSGHHKSRKTKTAGESHTRRTHKHEDDLIDTRAVTAPSKQTRKGWGSNPPEIIKIKTGSGDKINMQVPGVYSGKYSEDFEVYQSFLENKLEEEEGDSSNDESSDSENEDESEASSESEDGLGAKLNLSVQDVKTLRASLEMDSSIMRSIASVKEEVSDSDSDDDDDVEDNQNNNTGFGLEEIEEELPEYLNASNSNFEKDVSEELIDIEDSDQDTDDDQNSSESNEDVEENTKNEGVTIEDNLKDLMFKSVEKGPDVLEFTKAAPKSRPVTASRKRSEETSLPNTVISQDVIAAIAEENKKLEEYRRGKRDTKTAPESKTPFPALKLEERPDTVGNTMSNDVINSITEKVRKLGGRQQRKLLKMLAELEAAEEEICVKDWDSEKDLNRKFLQVEKNNRKSKREDSSLRKNKEKTNEENLMENTPSELDTSVTTRLSGLQKSMSEGNFIKTFSNMDLETKRSLDIARKPAGKKIGNIEVVVEFSSNWGNKDFIGLTEIEFIDNKNKPINVGSHDIEVQNNNIISDNIKSIVDGKTKTVKDRHMWKRDYNEEDNLTITFMLPLSSPEKLCKIVVWNYNRHLQDLNIGVKDCRILIDEEVKWEGVIDKGCGNQIFDYSKIITLRETEEELADTVTDTAEVELKRPGTRTIDSSGENFKHLPVVEITISEHPSDYDKPTQKVRSDQFKKNSYQERPKSTSSKPLWLEEASKPKEKGKKEDLDFVIDDSLRPRSRPSSGRRSQQGNDSIDDILKPNRPTSGRRSGVSTPDKMEEMEKKELDDLFDLNVKPKSGRRGVFSPEHKHKGSSKKTFSPPPQTGRQSPLLIDMPSKIDEEIKTNRKKFKELMDVNLEQSLQSIDNFKFHHLGRLTANLDDDDDDFGSLVEPMKEKDRIDMQEKSTEKVDVQDEVIQESSDVLFELPILPRGKELIVNIKTTWGDRHYVGLNGIEVFCSSGHLLPIKNIRANPSDINILPEYEGDPRVVTNLMDGCYLTRDDMHLWLTPFIAGGDHLVELQFEEEAEVAMIRIWNYNKSRIHSTRGARFVEMALDGRLIFIGEIARASGVLSSEDPYGDTILFTMDEDILELVALNDFTYEVDVEDDESLLATSGDFSQRPTTADKAEVPLERPFTCPKSREGSRESAREATKLEEDHVVVPESDFMHCTVLTIFFSATWGDQNYLGLTGLELLGETFENICLNMDILQASPNDLNDLHEYDDDDRTLDKIINGVNVTMSDENMWMIPFNEDGTHLIKISFVEPTVITGLRVWNYNKSLEDTFRGAKVIHVYMDDFEVSPEEGYLLRKGPGHCHFDFAQDVLFNIPDGLCEHEDDSKHGKINLHQIVNEYETLMMPSGFVFQFKLFSSWSDPYYVGLNGIEVYDKYGKKIELSDNNITAFPHSVNVLEGVEDDLRTPDKLIDGVNDTHDGRHMWLAPIYHGKPNIIYLVFDEPVSISMIKLWNYSKTPARGARQFGLLVDDLLVYSGVLPQCAIYARAIIPGIELPIVHHTILFTDAEDIALKERHHLLSSTVATQEQAVQLTNDRSILTAHQDKYDVKGTADPAMRPMTSVKSAGKKRR